MKRIFCFLVVVLATIIVMIQIVTITALLTEKEKQYEDNHGNILKSFTESIDISQLLLGSNVVESVNTRYSILYKCGMNRKMYVFTSSVRNQTEDIFYEFDRRLLESEEGYYSDNVGQQIVFMEKGILLGEKNNKLYLNLFSVNEMSFCDDHKNFYGNTVDAIDYSLGQNKVYASSTYGGVLLDCTLYEPSEEMNISINYGDLSVENTDADYCVISDDNGEVFIINCPLFFDADGKYIGTGKAVIKGPTKERKLIFLGPDGDGWNYPIKMSVIIDKYGQKMFYDSTAVVDNPRTNSIFNYVTVFNQDESSESAYTYLKFNVRSFTPKESSLLDEAILYMYVLSCDEETVVETYSVRNDWCSWTLTWKNRPKHYEKIGEFNVSNKGWYGIDLTEYFKRLIEDDYYGQENNSIMLKIKTGYTGNFILASGDNTEAPPFFEINYRVN